MTYTTQSIIYRDDPISLTTIDISQSMQPVEVSGEFLQKHDVVVTIPHQPPNSTSVPIPIPIPIPIPPPNPIPVPKPVSTPTPKSSLLHGPPGNMYTRRKEYATTKKQSFDISFSDQQSISTTSITSQGSHIPVICSNCKINEAVARVHPCEDELCKSCIASSRCPVCGAVITASTRL